MACGAGGPGLYGCGAAVRARGASCRATRPAASRLDRLGSYHRGGGRLTSSAPYLTPKWGGMPTQPGPSAPAVRVSRSRSARAPSAPSLAPFSAERGVRAAVRVARSGSRFTCVTACRGACSGLARAVELSTAQLPSVKPTCAGESAPSVHKEVGSGVPSASHVACRRGHTTSSATYKGVECPRRRRHRARRCYGHALGPWACRRRRFSSRNRPKEACK